MAQQTVNNSQHPEQQDTRMNQWRIDVKQLLDATRSSRPSSGNACIFRVPKLLKDRNWKAYVPQMVSLGPLHCQRLSTQMHDHKVEAAAKMLKRLGKEINFVVEEIAQLEDKIRCCYNEKIKYDRETLASIMTFDGCFLLEIFRTIIWKLNPSEIEENFQPIIGFLRGYMVLGDIMMLENQIPLCVLVKLLQLELRRGDEHAQRKLSDLAYRCLMSKASPFKYPHHAQTPEKFRDKLKPEELMGKSEHLLDFWRLCMESVLNEGLKSEAPREGGKPLPMASIPSANELKSSRIEIKPCKDDKLSEIRFESKGLRGAALFLPPVLITGTTEAVIRNLMALEECRAYPQNVISRYVQLMDSLIDSREDVSLLIKNGVIDNRLGSEEEVVALFNSLSRGISCMRIPAFDDVLRQVEECRNRHDDQWNLHGIIAQIYEKTLSSPILLLSFVVAIAYLGMSAAQTYYAAHK